MTEKLTPLKPYEPNWPLYCTRDGRPARVICTDALGNFPIIALVRDGGSDLLQVYRADGSYSPFAGERTGDLMCAAPPEPGPLIERWLVQDRDGSDCSFPFTTLGEAQNLVVQLDKVERRNGPHGTVHMREVRK